MYFGFIVEKYTFHLSLGYSQPDTSTMEWLNLEGEHLDGVVNLDRSTPKLKNMTDIPGRSHVEALSKKIGSQRRSQSRLDSWNLQDRPFVAGRGGAILTVKKFGTDKRIELAIGPLTKHLEVS